MYNDDIYIKCDKCHSRYQERHITQYIGLGVNLCVECDSLETAEAIAQGNRQAPGPAILPAHEIISGAQYKAESQPAWCRDHQTPIKACNELKGQLNLI